MKAGRLPEGYVSVTWQGVDAFAWAGAAEWLRSCLREWRDVYAWAGGHARESRAGRGPVHVVEAPVAGPDERPRWAVRRYRRGGAIGPLLGDRYWGRGRTRAERELEASLHARAQGVLTPAVVAGAVYRHGSLGAAGVYRADLVTEWVPQAHSLTELLFDGAGEARPALERAGQVARSLAQAGVMHPDLSAGNVLIDAQGDAWVVDLDRCRKLRRPSERAGIAMLERLERSLAKLGAARKRPLAGAERSALRTGFGGTG